MTDHTPTMRDVAARAGVSTATVSLVLNGERASKGRVTQQTRDRVLDSAEELGYELNHLARGLRRGRIDQVSVVVRSASTPWAQTLTSDVARVSETHGYSTVMFVSGDWQAHLRQRISSGAIVDAGWDSRPDLSALRPAMASGLALVVLSNHLEPDGFDVIQANERAARDEAMSYLIGLGRTRIACLRERPEHLTDQTSARYSSYRNALTEHGLEVDDSLTLDVYSSRERAYAATLDLLNRDPQPDAIFATSDFAAISALWAAHRRGLRVPDDLAIIGVGNSPESEFTDPPLTTVGPYRVDFTAAAQMLFDRITGLDRIAGRSHLQQWQVIHRGTA